jgi:hypothetical protein
MSVIRFDEPERQVDDLAPALLGQTIVGCRLEAVTDEDLDTTFAADWLVLDLEDGSTVRMLDGWGFAPIVEIER